MLRQILIHLLLALDFLHSECHIIQTGQFILLTLFHTKFDEGSDIKEENILLGLVDSSISEQLDTTEIVAFC